MRFIEQYGAQAFPDAKTPEAAKGQIRESLIRNRALTDGPGAGQWNLPAPFSA